MKSFVKVVLVGLLACSALISADATYSKSDAERYENDLWSLCRSNKKGPDNNWRGTVNNLFDQMSDNSVVTVSDNNSGIDGYVAALADALGVKKQYRTAVNNEIINDTGFSLQKGESACRSRITLLNDTFNAAQK